MTRASALIAALSIFATACASVPRDAGVADVRAAVSERTSHSIEWRDPSPSDDPQLRALLQEELTADHAVAVALANSPRLQATLAELGVARAEMREASLVRNPLFELEIRFPRDPFRPYELRVAETLVDLIQLPRRRAIARATFDAATLRITSAVVRFAADVRADHAELVAASLRVAESRTNLEAARAAAELAQRQHDAQNITDLDLENEQAQYEDAKLALAQDEQRLVLARETLIAAMGVRDATIDLRLPAGFAPLPAAEDDAKQLEALASSRRIDIDLARRELDLARRRIPLARLAVLGDITVDAHDQRDASGAHTFGPGIEVPIPILNNGAAARSRAEAEYVRAAQEVNARMVEAASELRAARAVVEEARARVAYYRDVVVPRRHRIVELTKLEHNAMLVGPFQLLDARRNETRARRDFIDAQRDYWIARNDLDRALNGVASAPPTNDERRLQRGTTSPKGGH